MKKITVELDVKEFQMLQEITNLFIKVKNVNAITDSEMNEAIRALILKSYISERVPIKYGKDSVVTVERNKK
ncbi:hypothetical protein ACFYKT_01610 [Cytobacillus sp. FJAT-53684]|uniref:DUF2922 domain-containing protein n=1 Tax=Cytobacillus mangrovibacter TaxID=3299024 RepID=A0ABW6JU72_9BACI